MKRLYIAYDGEADELELRDDIYAWLDAQGYEVTGKDEDEYLVPESAVAAVEAKIEDANTRYRCHLVADWIDA